MDNSHSDLTFNVAQLLKEPVGSTRKLNFSTPTLLLYDPQQEEPDDDTMQAHGVEGHVKVTRVRDGVLVQGGVKADVTLQCSRCLEDFGLPVDATLEEEYQPTIDIETGMPIHRAEYEQNDAAFDIDPNHLMDLTEPVRQALLVSLPMKPLHSKDCKGLCPICGANLNEVDCGHRPETDDERWSGLRALRLEDFPSGDSNN